jgi:hypothetical protein
MAIKIQKQEMRQNSIAFEETAKKLLMKMQESRTYIFLRMVALINLICYPILLCAKNDPAILTKIASLNVFAIFNLTLNIFFYYIIGAMLFDSDRLPRHVTASLMIGILGFANYNMLMYMNNV